MKARWIRLGSLSGEAFDAACAQLAAAQSAKARPILAWAQAESRFLFAVIAPRIRAPGRSDRWLSWGLAPAVATYRQFGLRACLDEAGILLHGERIAEASACEIGECVLVRSSFLACFPDSRRPMRSAPLEEAFRLRLEAQHGWQFDHSWPTARERVEFALT